MSKILQSSQANSFNSFDSSDPTNKSAVQNLKEQDKKFKTARFKALIAVVSGALLIAGSSYYIMKEPSQWAPWVSQISASVTQQDSMMGKVKAQQTLLEANYFLNKKNIVELQNYSEVSEVLNKTQNTGFQYTLNESLYKKAGASLTQDQHVLEGLLSIPSLSNSAKTDESAANKLKIAKKTYLNSESMDLFTAYKGTPPDRLANIEELGKDLSAQKGELETTYKNVVQEVTDKLKKGNVDLNIGEQNFLKSANKEINTNKAQIDNAKKDLSEEEIAELLKINNDAYSQIASSVAADKTKVRALMDRYGANNVQVQPNSSGTGQTIVVNNQGSGHNSGMTFMDYWLLSHWMGSSSPSYNSGYAAGASSGSYSGSAPNSSLSPNSNTNSPNSPNSNSSLDKFASTSSSSSNSNSIAATQSAQKGYGSLYSINNPQSPVAQKFAATHFSSQDVNGRPSFNTLSQQIAAKRNATIAGRIEASRSSAMGEQSRANAVNSATKSVSAAARSGSMGHSGGGHGGSGGG